MDTNKMREQFEADFVEEMCRRGGEGFRSTVLHSLIQKKPDGDYQHITESLAWWAWQASREAVVVGMSKVECRFEVSEDTLSTIRGCLRSAEADIDQLKAESEALRKDAERYQWLRQGMGKVIVVEPDNAVSCDCDRYEVLLESEVDEAVDAEIAEESIHD